MLNIKQRLVSLLDRILPLPSTEQKTPQPEKKRRGVLSKNGLLPGRNNGLGSDRDAFNKAIAGKVIKRKLEATQVVDANGAVLTADEKTKHGFGMDDVKRMQKAFDDFSLPEVPETIGAWFGQQSFIGHQACATLAQHWLVDKACVMPAEDAIRKGWDITLNDGQELTDEQLDYIRELDVKLDIMGNLKEYVQFSRVFGIRIAMFLVDSADEKYYEKPFNIDGVKPGSYQGITQIDPYWIAPELDMSASANPVNKHFYEPTWWRMGGMRVHRSHLCVLIPSPVPDVLKPTYFFGGVPLTQKIFERVYNAERCAAEAVQLLMTKRANIFYCDTEEALAEQSELEERLVEWSYYRDNYGVKVIGEDERYEQQDTSLTDLDSTILTQYKLVAAIAGVPAPRLLQDSPAGSMNATGESESEVYREMLESIQANALTPVLNRHYELLMRSDVGTKYPELSKANIIANWVELDAMTEGERADVNLKKAQTDQALQNAGAIDGGMIQDRLIKDPNSGYSGIQAKLIEPPDDDLGDGDDDLNDDNNDDDLDGEGGGNPSKSTDGA